MALCRCLSCDEEPPPLKLSTSAAQPPAPFLGQLSSRRSSMRSSRIMLSARSLAANLLARERDPNVSFYRNLLQSEPGRRGEDGAFIEEMHDDWIDDYDGLESKHGYIQWLFPMFAGEGMNWRATPLTRAGAAKIRNDREMTERLVQSYRLMLRFYGLCLVDEATGALGRSDEYRERMANLEAHPHNLKRLSRILTSLGQLGLARYKPPLLFALLEAIDEGALRGHKPEEAAAEFWVPLVYDEGSEWYGEQTLEVDDDRAEGCMFEGVPRPPMPPRPLRASASARVLARTLTRKLSSAMGGLLKFDAEA